MKKSLVVSAIFAAMLAACSSTPKTDTTATPVKDATAGKANTDIKDSKVTTAVPDANGQAAWAELRDPKSILSQRSVYFDLDKYEVKSDYMPLLQAHAKFIAAHPTAKILVQGNTDERGSREYNLALGQKRANAVKTTMATLGVKEDRVEAVSLGEEKPRKTGHGEEVWAENRRSDILYNGEF